MQADTARRAAPRARHDARGDRRRLRRRACLAAHRGPSSRRRGQARDAVDLGRDRTACMLLAMHYCGESIRAAWQRRHGGGRRAARVGRGARAQPANRERFLALDPRTFIETLERWMLAYCPTPTSTVPGLPDDELSALRCADADLPQRRERPAPHARDVGATAPADPGSRLVEPPWPDDEWNQRGEAARNGTGALFERWPLLAPQLLEFVGGERFQG